MSFTDVAPASATSAAMAAFASSSDICFGRKLSITASSACSAAASSGRLPFSNISIDSRRCLAILPSTSITSTSSSAGAPPVRASISRFLIAAWISRMAATRVLSFAFMESTRPVLSSSRIIALMSP